MPTRLTTTLVSSSPEGAIYKVPVSSYSIVIAVANPVWLEVTFPGNPARHNLSMMLLPAMSPYRIPTTGRATVKVAARTSSIYCAKSTAISHLPINSP